MKKLLRLTLPWLLCVAIFAYIFTKTHPRELWSSLQHANLGLFIFYATAYFLLVHILDCFALKHFISRFAAPITHKESWIVRGVSYLLMIINYQAAQGAYAIYFKKTYNASAAKTFGTLVFVNMMDVVLIATFAGIALLFAPHTPANEPIRIPVFTLLSVLYVSYVLFVLFWKKANSPFMVKLKRFKMIRWILEHNIFIVFREATLKDFLELVVYRFLLTFVAAGAMNFALFAFDSKILWLDLYVYNPIVMLVASLPITPAGLGTAQFLIIELFKDKVQSPLISAGTLTPESLLLTASLVWILANQILKVIFGSVCLGLSSRKLFSR